VTIPRNVIATSAEFLVFGKNFAVNLADIDVHIQNWLC
jgi:hypothetical protein